MAKRKIPGTRQRVTADTAKQALEKHGTYRAAAKALGIPASTLQGRVAKPPISQDETKLQSATRDEIIAEILRVINQDTTKVVTRNHFRNVSRYAESAWFAHFGTWEQAKREANVTLSRHAHRLGLNIAKHASVDRLRALNGEKRAFEGKYLRPASGRWQTTVVFNDTHGLHCDPFFRRVLIDTLRRVQPEKIVLNGDIVDLAEFSKHTQDPRQFKVLEELRWLHSLLADIRKACPNAESHYVGGNHELRLLRHMSEQSPALMVVLSDLHGFTISKLLGLDKFEINYIDRADMTAWNERDINNQLRKNYVTLFDRSLLFGHYPEMRNMGIPGANGHHHKHVVWPAYSPTYGSYEWHQVGCGHMREASYCSGERWSQAFMICYTDTVTKRTQFDYVDVSHSAAMVGGKFYERGMTEPVLDLVA